MRQSDSGEQAAGAWGVSHRLRVVAAAMDPARTRARRSRARPRLGRVLRIRRPDVHTGIGRSAVLAQDADDQGTDHIETLGARTTWRHTLASRHNLACAYLEAQRPTEAVVSASWVPLTRTR
jgi:hypothetical protein